MSWLRCILTAFRPANTQPNPPAAVTQNPPSPPPYVPRAYQRDPYDLLLHRTAALLAYVNVAEAVCLTEAFSMDGKIIGYVPPKDVLTMCQAQVPPALDVMQMGAYRDHQLCDRDYLMLLARIGQPNIVAYHVDPSGRHETQYWPRADREATRPDLLHFYLLVKLKYLTLKAEMQNRVPTPEELADLAEIAQLHIHVHPSTPTTPESFRNDVLQSWRRA